MGSSEKSGERIPMTASMSQQPGYYQPVMGIPLDSAYNYAVPTAPSLGGQVQNASPTKWSTGLCSCSKNVGNCCLTCWCPCITFGRIAEITDRGATTCETGGAIYALLMLAGFSCFYSCCYRSKLRSQYSLVETPCPDFLVHCCCESCALCQEYRELEGRGFDMSAGWYGNVQRQTRGVTTIATTAPMMPGAMSR